VAIYQNLILVAEYNSIYKAVHFSYFKPSGGAINSTSFQSAGYFRVVTSISEIYAVEISKGGQYLIVGGGDTINGF
jgi:hypothetical protein